MIHHTTQCRLDTFDRWQTEAHTGPHLDAHPSLLHIAADVGGRGSVDARQERHAKAAPHGLDTEPHAGQHAHQQLHHRLERRPRHRRSRRQLCARPLSRLGEQRSAQQLSERQAGHGPCRTVARRASGNHHLRLGRPRSSITTTTTTTRKRETILRRGRIENLI